MISKIILQHQKNGSFGKSELDTALAISALINLDYKGLERKKGSNYLIKNQSKKEKKVSDHQNQTRKYNAIFSRPYFRT